MSGHKRIGWAVSLAILAVVSAESCTRKHKPPPQEEEEKIPPTPAVDQQFLDKALGAGLALANKPLLKDIDRRLGTEALIATHRGGSDFQVAVVRGNHQVLSRAPLGGKILAHANIQAVGEFKAMDLFGDGAATYLMPVDTLVYQRSVCGLLAFRYRSKTLSLIGEFSFKCWRPEAGGDGSDPYTYFSVKREGKQVFVETAEEHDETRRYRWDESQQAFLTIEKLPGK
jgi:hypothetical protein